MAGFKQSIKTVVLLGALSGLLLLIGGAIGGNTGITIALGFALVMNLGSWWFSDKMVIAMTRAQPLPPADHPRLYRMVEELSRNAGIPMPRLYWVPDRSPNAFATGRGPGHAVVAVHQGLLDLLNEREIRGVLAHEIAHIKDRDVLVSSVAAAIASAIVWLAYMLQWAAIFGVGGSSDDDGRSSPLALLGLALLAPIAATIIQLAVSRSREFKADSVVAAISGDPDGLADALEKLTYANRRIPLMTTRSSAVHRIVHPLSGGGMTRLFSTHPPLEARISRLRAMSARG